MCLPDLLLPTQTVNCLLMQQSCTAKQMIPLKAIYALTKLAFAIYNWHSGWPQELTFIDNWLRSHTGICNKFKGILSKEITFMF